MLSIRKNTDSESWNYCNTDENPADIITRDSNRPNTLWWQGPRFLYGDEYPITEENDNLFETTPGFGDEISTSKTTLHASVVDNKSVGNVIKIQRYHDILKLFRVIALVLRFVNNLKAKVNKGTLCLNKYVISSELKDAKLLWIKDNQSSLNAEYYNNLKVNLNLQVDESGVIRSYSRLKYAKIPYDAKAPILINRKHRLAELIVYHAHLRVLHRREKDTLTEIRANYWIPRGRSFVKKLLHPCTLCRKLNARSYKYPAHSDLPALRFDDRYPFSSTGIDYLGPLYCLPVYGDVNKTFKSWVVIYTCAAIRAVILDVVSNMKAPTFISSLTQFISRRGCPNTIISDNGKYFIADETQRFAGNRFISWKFILENAPWFGGMWERLVASVKRCLKKVIGVKVISYDELQTLVLEIELILNNRPIDADFDDSQEVVTPNHLTFGRRLNTMGDTDAVEMCSNDADYRPVKGKRVIDTILNHFWKRWRKEYLTSLRDLQRKTNVSKGSQEIQLHDIVLIYDDKQPRHLWNIVSCRKSHR